MAFCSNCGNEIMAGSRFCNSCGIELQKEDKIDRTVKTLSCPQCGAIVNSFIGKCESCGTEFFGLDASKSVKEFAQQLSAADSDKQRVNLIKTFPIPNTKEDIMEYMILASSNIGYSEDLCKCKEKEEYEDAWIAKFFQGYQKAKLVFANDKEFSRIQDMYEDTLLRKENMDNERRKKVFTNLLIKNLGTACGVVALLVAFVMNILSLNSSLIELTGAVVLIISASVLKKREATNLDYALVVGSGLVSTMLSFLFSNGSMLMLGGVITIIVSVVSFLKQSIS